MSTVDLTADTLDSILDGDGIAVIDWWASWCGPCRQFAPVFAAASEQHTDITFAKVDTEAEGALAQQYGISSIPTLTIVRDGIPVYHEAGALPAPALEQLIEGTRALDMADVRRQYEASVAEHQAQQNGSAPQS